MALSNWDYDHCTAMDVFRWQNNMAREGRAVVFIVLCWMRFGICASNRDRTVFTKLTILEDEIIAMKSSIQRNEVSRKADLEILRQNINIRLESIVAKVLSDVIDDKTKAGEIRGVVEGSVNSLLQHQQHQIQQLKTYVRNAGTRQPLPVPRKADDRSRKADDSSRKADDSSRKLIKRFRMLNKKLKKYESEIKELRDEILQQNLQILEFKSEFSEKMNVLELRRKREQKTEFGRNPATTAATTTLTTEMPPVSGVGQASSVNSVSRTVSVGDRVELECLVSGYPRPTVVWSRLKGAMSGNAVIGDNVLIIPEVGNDDEGTYKCTASNSGGSSEQRVRLFVIGKIRNSTAVEACEGSTAVLRCSNTDIEKTVSWKRGSRSGNLIYFNNRVYYPDRRFSVQRPYSSEWHLLINSVTSKDEGTYVCLVHGGQLESKFRLKVKSC